MITYVAGYIVIHVTIDRDRERERENGIRTDNSNCERLVIFTGRAPAARLPSPAAATRDKFTKLFCRTT